MQSSGHNARGITPDNARRRICDLPIRARSCGNSLSDSRSDPVFHRSYEPSKKRFRCSASEHPIRVLWRNPRDRHGANAVRVCCADSASEALNTCAGGSAGAFESLIDLTTSPGFSRVEAPPPLKRRPQ